MKAYINSVGMISPQRTFDGAFFSDGMTEYNQQAIRCVEPDYKTLIDPVKLRRMSRILKMGLGAASICMGNSGVRPDAVIVGTGLACLTDLEKFFFAIKNEKEQFLSPIPFINSSHNMIGSQIAIAFKLNGYNMTYIHNALSFENALLDALMRIGEGDAENVLLGGIDEYTQQFHQMADNQGLWRKSALLNSQLFDGAEEGTLYGEGSSFFMLGAKATENSLAKVVGTMTMVGKNLNVEAEAENFIKRYGLSLSEVDTVVLGRNGDCRTDKPYIELEKSLPYANVVYYKHLCGEYLTSTAFAMWMSANILNSQHIPQFALMRKGRSSDIRKVLIYNQYEGVEHSFTLLERI